MKESFLDRILGKVGLKVLRVGKDVEVVNLKEVKVLRTVFSYFSFLLLFWGLYRFLAPLPGEIEDFFLKPLIWLGSLAWVVLRIEKRPLASLGLSKKGLLKSFYWGIPFGLLFAFEGLLVNIAKYGELNLAETELALGTAFLISLVTAICEELVFRGFIFSRLLESWKKVWQVNLVVSCLFVLIHLPITIFVLRYSLFQTFAYALIVFLYSLGAGLVFAKTQNILAPILLHVFWSWPVILLR
jgi:membrane protease YdiL (CAAX protease family)